MTTKITHYQNRHKTAQKLMCDAVSDCKRFNKMAAYVAYYRDKLWGL